MVNKNKLHNFHILPKLMMMSINAPAFFIGLVMLMHVTFGLARVFEYLEIKINVSSSVFLEGLIFAMVEAWIESYYAHTTIVKRGLVEGFILSEIMLFISMFWGFFHSTINILYPVVTILFLLSENSLAISLTAAHNESNVLEKFLEFLIKFFKNFLDKVISLIQKNFEFFNIKKFKIFIILNNYFNHIYLLLRYTLMLKKTLKSNFEPNVKSTKNLIRNDFGLGFLLGLGVFLVFNELVQKNEQLYRKNTNLTAENTNLKQEIIEKNIQIDNLKGIDITDIYFSYTYDFFLSYEFLNQNPYYCHIILSLNLIFFFWLTIYIYLSYLIFQEGEISLYKEKLINKKNVVQEKIDEENNINKINNFNPIIQKKNNFIAYPIIQAHSLLFIVSDVIDVHKKMMSEHQKFVLMINNSTVQKTDTLISLEIKFKTQLDELLQLKKINKTIYLKRILFKLTRRFFLSSQFDSLREKKTEKFLIDVEEEILDLIHDYFNLRNTLRLWHNEKITAGTGFSSEYVSLHTKCTTTINKLDEHYNNFKQVREDIRFMHPIVNVLFTNYLHIVYDKRYERYRLTIIIGSLVAISLLSFMILTRLILKRYPQIVGGLEPYSFFFFWRAALFVMFSLLFLFYLYKFYVLSLLGVPIRKPTEHAKFLPKKNNIFKRIFNTVLNRFSTLSHIYNFVIHYIANGVIYTLCHLYLNYWRESQYLDIIPRSLYTFNLWGFHWIMKSDAKSNTPLILVFIFYWGPRLIGMCCLFYEVVFNKYIHYFLLIIPILIIPFFFSTYIKFSLKVSENEIQFAKQLAKNPRKHIPIYASRADLHVDLKAIFEYILFAIKDYFLGILFNILYYAMLTTTFIVWLLN